MVFRLTLHVARSPKRRRPDPHSDSEYESQCEDTDFSDTGEDEVSDVSDIYDPRRDTSSYASDSESEESPTPTSAFSDDARPHQQPKSPQSASVITFKMLDLFL